VDGKSISSYPPPAYFLLYKPRNVVTSLYDPFGRRTVKSIVEGRVGTRVFPVGRLDYDAEGVLILTNDGELAQALLHPRYGIPRTYMVKVKGIPKPEEIAMLKRGIPLEEGVSRAFDVKIVRSLRANCWMEIVLNEGRNREIKRLCEAIGHPVLRLLRSKFAFLTAKGIRPGELRPLTGSEVSRLRELVSERKGPGRKNREKGQVSWPER